MDIIAKFSPNNEVRLISQKLNHLPVRQRGDSSSLNDQRMMAQLVYDAQLSTEDGGGTLAALFHHKDGQKLCTKDEAEVIEHRRLKALDIISEVQQKRKYEKQVRPKVARAGYGRLGGVTRFTKFARRRILAGSNVVEARCKSVSQSAFITLTLPGSTPSAIRLLAEWSSYVCNRVFTSLRQAFARYSSSDKSPWLDWFYVWEFQKRGALHLHIALSTDRPDKSIALGEVAVHSWWKALEDVGTKVGGCLFASSRLGGRPAHRRDWQSDVQSVRKSLASYLSKYVSKSSGASNEAKSSRGFGGQRRYYPPRLWGMSRNLVQEVERASPTIKVRSQTVSRVGGLIEILHKELITLGIVQKYQWGGVCTTASGFELGWHHETVYYMQDRETYETAKEWLLQLIPWLLSDQDFGLFEYAHNDPSDPYWRAKVNKEFLALKVGQK